MYNSELKERFLENLSGYAAGTIKNYRYILNKASETEEPLGKDIYAFSFGECDSLLRSYSNRSIDMVMVTKSCLESYVSFCIDEGFVPTRINYFSGLNKDDLRKYVDQTAVQNKYLTYEGLKDLEEQCNNAQDAVIARLLFVGVRGLECEELINLRKEDIKLDRIILKDREIPIDDSTYQLIKDAIYQEFYERGNGEPDPNSRIARLKLIDSDYVLRPAGANKTGALLYPSLRMRMVRIKEYFDNPYLNFRNIWFSGIIHKLKEIKAEKGELTKDDYITVHKLFGYGEGYWSKTAQEVAPYL